LTINIFIGVSVGDVKLEPVDYSGYDVIVFGEVYFSCLSVYWKKQFVEQSKHNKIIITTGDAKQLRSVQELINTQNHE
jgi:hypothetical protein